MTVDIHCHILPGLDDGAKTQKDAIIMAQKAVTEGIKYLVCTPHLNQEYLNKKGEIIQAVSDMQKVLDDANIPLTLFEGQEVQITEDLYKRLLKDEVLFLDLKDKYLLLEFPNTHIPDYSYSVISKLCSEGVVPIIAHPERQKQFIKKPDKLKKYIDLGCLSQITNASYFGNFGPKIQKVSTWMIKNNYAQILASDAHNISSRGFYKEDAIDLLEMDFGIEKVEQFEQIVKDIVNGDELTVDYRKSHKKKFWLF